MPQGTPHPTVIPFLKVYIALTAPERTDSQSMLHKEETQTHSLCYKEAQTHSLCYNSFFSLSIPCLFPCLGGIHGFERRIIFKSSAGPKLIGN